tara:strand:+ start:4040 stop:4300 length:261 start_codon:yes stop_codon:yes gene_type:complete
MSDYLYLARYETRSYNFEVIASYADLAKNIMIEILTAHGDKHGLNENMEDERNVILWFEEDDIVILEVKMNKCYEDGLGEDSTVMV